MPGKNSSPVSISWVDEGMGKKKEPLLASVKKDKPEVVLSDKGSEEKV